MSYTIVHFRNSGIAIEGYVIGVAKSGWITVKTFFTGTVYKVRRTRLFQGRAPLPY